MKPAAVCYALTQTGFFGLLVTILLWHAWLAPTGKYPVALILIVLLTPLMIPMRGLLHGRPYTHAWASMLSLFYFCLGIMHAWSESDPAARAYGLALTVFSALFFNGAIFYVYYWRRQSA
jgi:uncharacterized membrane protein